MIKKRTRIIALMLVLMMAVSGVMAGCSNDSASNEKETENNDSASDEKETDNNSSASNEKETNGDEDKVEDSNDEGEKVAEEQNLVGNVYKTGLPIVKDKITLDVIVSIHPNIQKPIEDFETWAIMEEETNIKLNLEGIPSADYNEKVNLRIASATLPDMFTSSPPEVRTRYYNSGLFLKLNDYLVEWAPHVSELLSNITYYNALKSPDDNLYVFPKGEAAPWLDVLDQLFINKKWLDTLNLEVPTTIEEFRDVLIAFKENDPNGNDVADEIPFSTLSNLIYYMFGSYGLPLAGDLHTIIDRQYVFAGSHKGFREGLEYLNSLYEAGVFDPESFTQEQAQLKAKGQGEIQTLGSFIAFWPQYYAPEDQVKDYALVLPLKSENAEPVWAGNNQMPGLGYSVNADTEYPEAVVRWVDYLNSSTMQKVRLKSGPESNGSFTPYDDGTFYMNSANEPDGPVPEGVSYSQWVRNNMLFDLISPFMTSEETAKYRVVDGVAKYKLDLVQAYLPYVNMENSITGGHWSSINDKDREILNSFDADTDSLIENFLAKSIMEGVTDDSWNTFQNNLNGAGLEKVVEIRSNAINDFYGN